PEPTQLAVDVRPHLAAVGVRFAHGEVRAFGCEGVSLAAGETIASERVVLAAGSDALPPPIAGFAEHGMLLDTRADAERLREAVAALPARAPVVVIGAGFTGVELAAELAERQHVVLVERARELAPSLGDGPRPAIAAALAELGVELRLGASIASVDAGGVTLADGAPIPARAVFWTGGLRASPLTQQVAAERDEAGRLVVDEFLCVPDAPWLFAAGDVAAAIAAPGRTTLMSCQYAMPTGCVAGHNAVRSLLDLPLAPFSAPTYTTCLDLGRAGAMLSFGFERRVARTGNEAKIVKRFINGRVILPPPAERAALLAAAALPAPRSEVDMLAFFDQLIRSETRASA
ncbi:MAG TPA: FAD-dependent oxidoreductase, partial [Myxococcota bacterium]|nr:FAD-dependent oxidoreductase [Myxococcota bacterium]